MDLNFLEHKKTRKYDKKEDAEVEVIEDETVPFEVHPHELISSVATRYAVHKRQVMGAPEPPPGVRFYLRQATTGARLSPSFTVQELKKGGIILVELRMSL